MAVINLSEKYSSKIDKRFPKHSLMNGRLSNDYDFTDAKTVKIYGVNTIPLNDYDQTKVNGSRYGTPTDVGDTVQTMTMRRMRSFHAVLDNTYAVVQAIKKAGVFLRMEIDEVVNPERDAWTLLQIATNGGKIVGNATAITKSNVLERMNAAREHFANKRVPTEGRTWYVRPFVYSALILCDHFKDINKLGMQAIAKGHVGYLFNSPVIEVPEELMPANVNFMLVHKNSAINPMKLGNTKVNTEPEGVEGSIVTGVFYYDAFVRGQKADGIYVEVNTASGAGTVTADPTVDTAGKITVATGATCKYTTDGSDPRYSASAVTITATATVGTSGQTVKAYQVGTDAYPSGVASAVVA